MRWETKKEKDKDTEAIFVTTNYKGQQKSKASPAIPGAALCRNSGMSEEKINIEENNNKGAGMGEKGGWHPLRPRITSSIGGKREGQLGLSDHFLMGRRSPPEKKMGRISRPLEKALNREALKTVVERN